MKASLNQIIAIALASFSVGMNVGLLMAIGKKDTERGNKSRTLPQHRPPAPPPKPK